MNLKKYIYIYIYLIPCDISHYRNGSEKVYIYVCVYIYLKYM